jgi:hypothetical protein
MYLDHREAFWGCQTSKVSADYADYADSKQRGKVGYKDRAIKWLNTHLLACEICVICGSVSEKLRLLE